MVVSVRVSWYFFVVFPGILGICRLFVVFLYLMVVSVFLGIVLCVSLCEFCIYFLAWEIMSENRVMIS